jgi:3-deoxy-D-manno-octulosonic-acid transferase
LLARLLYGALLWLALPAVWLRLVWRGRVNPAYGPRRAERFGRVPAHVPRGAVWFHTVSAGETIAAAPLIRRLRATFPTTPFLVTTMTPTGSAQVRRLLAEGVVHCYAPYDFGFAVERFLDRVQPRLLVLMETELWPNLIGATAARGVPVVCVNARLSARSARGYARVGWLVRPMLERLDWVACQYADHAARFRALGLPHDRAEALGSVKFDASLPADHAVRVAALQERWRAAERPVWIAASTHAGEEEIVLAAHRRLLEALPDAALILVPRHPERCDRVASLASHAGLATARLTAGPSAGPSAHASWQVLLGDTMGELVYLYGLADVAFVGGSLVAVGGHNPVEPALVALPVVMGPHRYNFTDVVAPFTAAGCLHTVQDDTDLAHIVGALLGDRQARATQGQSALRVVDENRGATERLYERLTARIRAVTPEAAAAIRR